VLSNLLDINGLARKSADCLALSGGGGGELVSSLQMYHDYGLKVDLLLSFYNLIYCFEFLKMKKGKN